MTREKEYEYHKQNEYPGERIAERKRVADRKEISDRKADARVAEKGRTEGVKADNRVAEKGRRDNVLMDSEIRRSTNRAERVNRQRDSADAIGLTVIIGLIILLLAGSVWGFMTMQKQSDKIDSLNSELDKSNFENYKLNVANNQNSEEIDSNQPTLLSIYPSNNKISVPINAPISIVFGKDMDPLSINKNTFRVEQKSTAESISDVNPYASLKIDGTITYNDRKATFIPKNGLNPNQKYGNVFIVTITKEVKDIAGNSLMNDYVWSFTTGNYPSG